jgi:hypothetical protein
LLIVKVGPLIDPDRPAGSPDTVTFVEPVTVYVRAARLAVPPQIVWMFVPAAELNKRAGAALTLVVAEAAEAPAQLDAFL